MTRALLAFVAAIAIALTSSACADAREAAAAPAAIPGADVPGSEWFKQAGCTACHSVSVHNIWNLSAIGPDLSLAVEDVPRRFGVPLAEFLQAPTGTMAMVLATRIPLTREQRAIAIDKLKEAYQQHQEARGARPIASH